VNSQFSTTTLLSFHQWLDNWLLQRGQAYTNTSSRLYYQPDSRLPSNLVSYAAPFKSFVHDSGVGGAHILNAVSGSIGTIGRGQSGMMVDFVNGRVLLDSSVGQAATISGSYAFKDFNLYFANQSQERMVFTNKYYLNSRFARPIAPPPPPYDMVTPCIFISNVTEENEPGAFGGSYITKNKIYLNILTDNQAQMEGAMSVIMDSEQSSFPQLSPAQWPLNSYGDYKSGYNYEQIKEQYCLPGNLYTISDVRTLTFPDKVRTDQSLFIGLAHLTVERNRSIH